MEEPKGSIDRLKNALYSREGLQKRRPRRVLRNWGMAGEVPNAWTAEPEEQAAPVALFPNLQQRSVPSLILFGSIAFFIISLAVALFFFLGGSNLISNRNIDMAVSGPVATPGGQELSLQVAITNRNSVPIELADFVVTYPDTARSLNDLSLPLGRTREAIGTLQPGETVNKTVRAVLFGKEGEGQHIAMSLEYRVPGSNAIFVRDEKYEIVISSSPVAVVAHGLSQTTSGQSLNFTLDVISNSPTPVSDVMVTADYPSGFTFDSAEPRPSLDNDIWVIGTLNPGEKKTISVTGRLYGENNEKRTFHFTPGVQSEKNERELQTIFNVISQEVAISQPFISAALSVDGKTGTEFVAPAGDSANVSLSIANNLPTQVLDPEVLVKISGTAFNELSVRAQDGFYDSGTKTIRWTKETLPTLDVFSPGEHSKINFTLVPIDRVGTSFITNPTLTFDVTVRGRRLGESGVSETVESTVVSQVKISTDLKFTARGLYSSGPFPNTGPMPPKVGSETTYTVYWTLTNGANDVTNGKVSATLPSYMRWVGLTDPNNASMTYNPVSRVVTWNVGNVLSKAGYEKPAQEIAFQVALIPSTSQIKKIVTLMPGATFTGTDHFTNSTVTKKSADVTTEIKSDPGYKELNSFVSP